MINSCKRRLPYIYVLMNGMKLGRSRGCSDGDVGIVGYPDVQKVHRMRCRAERDDRGGMDRDGIHFGDLQEVYSFLCGI